MDNQSPLDKALMLWASSNKKYRNSLIEIGSLLHEYLVSELSKGSGLNEQQRRDGGITRRGVIQTMATRLDVKYVRVNELIRTSMVVSVLLPEGMDLGALSYGAVRRFRRLIHRPNKNKARRSLCDDKSDCVEVRDTETWAVRPECEKWARHLLVRGATEGWNEPRVRQELISRCEETSPTARRYKVGDREKLDVLTVARRADHKDLVEMVKSLVAASSNPAEVSRMIREELEVTRYASRPLITLGVE